MSDPAADAPVCDGAVRGRAAEAAPTMPGFWLRVRRDMSSAVLWYAVFALLRLVEPPDPGDPAGLLHRRLQALGHALPAYCLVVVALVLTVELLAAVVTKRRRATANARRGE